MAITYPTALDSTAVFNTFKSQINFDNIDNWPNAKEIIEDCFNTAVTELQTNWTPETTAGLAHKGEILTNVIDICLPAYISKLETILGISDWDDYICPTYRIQVNGVAGASNYGYEMGIFNYCCILPKSVFTSVNFALQSGTVTDFENFWGFYSYCPSSVTCTTGDSSGGLTTILDNTSPSGIYSVPGFGRLGTATHQFFCGQGKVMNVDASASLYEVYVTASSINASTGSAENPKGKDTSSSGKYPSSKLGGQGTFDDTTTESEISTKPTINIANLGFFSIWNPSTSELVSLADYVWNDPTNISQWPQLFQSGVVKPLDYIMSLSMFPVSSSALTTQNENFSMGGIIFNGGVASLGKTITMKKVTQQIIDVDLGSISLAEYFGSFLDYAPYTTVSVYLPFYGVAELSMNEIQNASAIKIVYRINLFDGTTSIKIHITKTNTSQNNSVKLKHVLYEYNTNVKIDIPLTGGNNTEHMKMIATLIAGAAVAVAAPIAGAGAAALAGGTAATGAAAAGATASAGAQAASTAASGAVKAVGAGAQKAINAIGSGGGIHRGNIGSGNFGLLSEQKAFLIVNRPIQVMAENYDKFNGFSSNITKTLSEVSGFVKCGGFKLDSIDCTEHERQMIANALENGIFA